MAAPSASRVELTVGGGIATITLSNPGRANALSNATFREHLPALLEQVARKEGIRVLILTGADGAFCAGSELDADGFGDVGYDDTIELLRAAHRNAELLATSAIPTIAAIDGVAIGAGLGLATACDIRIASPRSRFSAPYVRMGLTPDMGLSATLPGLVGVANALDLALTGRMIDASSAESIGLVGRIADDPLAEARSLATAIAENPPGAVAVARSLVKSSAGLPLDDSLFVREPAAFADAMHGEEFASQFAAYRAALSAPRPPANRD
jgi:enoyl-CoA hydratase/carnithine racemase